MYKTIIVIALCLSGLAQAQEPRRSAQEVWNELYATPADWEKSGGKPVPIVRLIAVKERAARDSR